MLTPRGKIKVFISSICGVEKYDKLRTVLKQQIEETNLADVYLFEATGASTLTAQQHYVWELEDSDVCIFIIDNLDGVPTGVQKEIDAAKKHNKKSFFYFCDEQSKTPTAIQKGLTGPNTPKYKVVHSFNDLLEGAQSLIDDITEIYKYYCNGRFEPVEEAAVQVSLTEELCDVTLLIDKTIIENTDCCKMYFHKMFSKFEKEKKGTSDFDDWCARFLPVLFENASVKTFNTSMFLEELKKHQSSEHFAAVEKRWEAIQHYFNSDLQSCVESLEKALQIAKENNLSEWFIKDILIDLRNKRYELLETENKICVEDPAQQELINSQHALYYPLIDRMQSELYERFANDTFKTKIQSPHTVSLGYNITQTDIISNCYIVAMFNGSLTYLLLLHDRIKTLAFWMSCKFSDWDFRLLLIREIIFDGTQKELDSLHRAFPDILVKLNHSDAIALYNYCSNHPTKHRRMKAQLKALGMVGYYLDDDSFSKITRVLVDDIRAWLQEEEPVFSTGEFIFKCLKNIGHRMKPEILVEISCEFIKRGFSRFYSDMFEMITSKIDIGNLSPESANTLISHISSLLIDDKEKVLNLESVLILFRKQSVELTQDLDKLIAEKKPEFYNNLYKLETSTKKEDDVNFVKEYVNQIKTHNQEQGKNGVYFGYSSLPHDTIRNILLIKGGQIEEEVINSAFEASCETLLLDNQQITTKCQAVDLIIFLVQRYPLLISNKAEIIEKLKENQEKVLNCNTRFSDSNVSDISLKFAYVLLLSFFDNNNCMRLLEALPYAQNHIPDQLRILKTILYYLENDEKTVLEPQLEAILLHTTLSWIDAESVDIRWYCVRILFLLGRNKTLHDIIGYQIINLIDNDNAFIRNLIQRNIKEHGIDNETQKYVSTKCSIDNNYVVRKVYNELNA